MFLRYLTLLLLGCRQKCLEKGEVVDIPRPKGGPLVMVPGSVEAERMFSTMFSTMTFIKDNLRNRLTTHLSPCARIYSQHTYTLSNFPYAEAIMAWRAAAPTRGRYGSKN